jgi:hypothetical protein
VLPLCKKKTIYGVAKSRRKVKGDACVTLRETINEHRILVVKPERREFLESTYFDEFTIL